MRGLSFVSIMSLAARHVSRLTASGPGLVRGWGGVRGPRGEFDNVRSRRDRGKETPSGGEVFSGEGGMLFI